MKLYGLRGFNHGWGKLLTVMSPDGSAAVRRQVLAGDEVSIEAEPGALVRYVELREGGLDRLIERYGIEVLDKPQWDAMKASLTRP